VSTGDKYQWVMCSGIQIFFWIFSNFLFFRIFNEIFVEFFWLINGDYGFLIQFSRVLALGESNKLVSEVGSITSDSSLASCRGFVSVFLVVTPLEEVHVTGCIEVHNLTIVATFLAFTEIVHIWSSSAASNDSAINGCGRNDAINCHTTSTA